MSCQWAALIIAGLCSDKLYYEHRQAGRLAIKVQARCRPMTYQMTERSAYLLQQNAHSGNGFSPAATPAFIEPAVSPLSEQAWLTRPRPGGGNRFGGSRDMLTYYSRKKHQLNNLTLSLAASFALAGLIFHKNSKYVGTRGCSGLKHQRRCCDVFLLCGPSQSLFCDLCLFSWACRN